jgi:hypothetical protein
MDGSLTGRDPPPPAVVPTGAAAPAPAGALWAASLLYLAIGLRLLQEQHQVPLPRRLEVARRELGQADLQVGDRLRHLQLQLTR